MSDLPRAETEALLIDGLTKPPKPVTTAAGELVYETQ